MIQLRGYVFLDSLQPQLAAIIANTSNGYPPSQDMTSLFIEVAPAITANRLLDVALKQTAVFPSMLVVEREFGVIEVHHADQGEVRQAGQAVLASLNATEKDRFTPQVLSSQIIRGVEAYHAQILNKEGRGQKIAEGESLYILETEPAAYITLAANEAEKAANIKIIDIKYVGAFGRLYLSGPEAEIDAAAAAARRALEHVQ